MTSPNLDRRHFMVMAGAVGATLCVDGLMSPALASHVDRPVTLSRVMMGTYVTITVAAVSSMQATEALDRAFNKISALESIFSRHQSTTPVAELNRVGTLSDAPVELVDLMGRAQRYGVLTSGAFDITVQPVIDLFRAHKTSNRRMELDAQALKEAQELVGMNHVHMHGHDVKLDRQGMGITLDGIAKGHIADMASAELLKLGVRNHIINAGGDIVVRGMKTTAHNGAQPWRVGISAPQTAGHGSDIIDAIALTDAAVATSGSYEVYYDASRAHHHLISPSTGASPSFAASVSVKAPTAMEADALATALSVVPPHDALRLVQSLPARECLIVTRDGRRLQSHGWA
ncbi:MAG: FAD:protein FMN transferase [Pseudomonadota bacterium]